jgi:hypothetical protein
MATKAELEKKASYRAAKSVFLILAALVLLATVGIWYVLVETRTVADNAYYTCLGSNEKRALEETEIADLESSYGYLGPDQRLQADCLGLLGASFISDQDMRIIQYGPNQYALGGLEEEKEWHVMWLLIALAIEYALFLVLKRTGLYIAGGKEALG